MSRYCTIRTIFKDKVALVDALIEIGEWTSEQIEVYNDPKNLFGFKGDVRSQVAHIIIRRKHVGRSSNDIGFLKDDDGNYKAIISEFDRNRYNQSWLGKLKGSYAFHRVKRQQEALGRSVSRERCRNGHQRVVVTGYR